MIVFGTTALFRHSLLRMRRTYVFLFSARLCFCSLAGVLEEAHLSVIYILAADRPSPLPAVRCPNVGGQRGGRSACNWKWPLAGFPCQALSLSANWHDEHPEYTAASVDWWRPASGELLPDSGAPQPICRLSLTGGSGLYVCIHPWLFCAF